MQRQWLPLFLALPLLLSAGEKDSDRPARPTPAASEDGISVYFSPDGGATDAIVARLNAAKSTVDLQAYYFTSSSIAKGVAEAHRRGVKVRCIIDASAIDEQYSVATYLTNANVPVWLDDEHNLLHNKVIIVDSKFIITGSFNFTRMAEVRNAENLLVIEGKKKLIQAYQQNFDDHFKHSKKYKGKK